jgi:NarL family two-component system response regulator YdfI
LIRVLVWAKSAVMRAGLEALVRADARFEVANTERQTADLVASVRELAPDVVLLDGGVSSWTELSSSPGAPQAVVLLESVRRAEVLRILQSGVRGLLLREAHPEEIAEALVAAHNALAVMSPEVLDVLVPASAEAPTADELPPGEPLTPREIAVLALLADGAGNKEIASRLRISEHTVKFHVSSILSKLGAATRTEAVTRGYKEGLILI